MDQLILVKICIKPVGVSDQRLGLLRNVWQEMRTFFKVSPKRRLDTFRECSRNIFCFINLSRRVRCLCKLPQKSGGELIMYCRSHGGGIVSLYYNTRSINQHHFVVIQTFYYLQGRKDQRSCSKISKPTLKKKQLWTVKIADLKDKSNGLRNKRLKKSQLTKKFQTDCSGSCFKSQPDHRGARQVLLRSQMSGRWFL